MARKTKQQAQETRQHILDSAVDIFSMHGVSSTSLSDIATAAGVTRGAIYWHFKNKVDLFNEVWHLSETKFDNIEASYQQRYPNNPLRMLREILVCVLQATVTDPQRHALLEIIFHKCEFIGEMTSLQDARVSLYHERYERIEIVLQRCIEHQQLPPNLHTHRAAIMLRAYMTGLMENWLFTPESFDLYDEAPYLVDSFLDILCHSTHLLHAPATNSNLE